MEILLPDCVKAMFLPASSVTVSPGLMSSVLVPETVPSDLDVVRLKPELLMALATLSPVT